MSAYIVSKEHLDALMYLMVKHLWHGSPRGADEVGQMLMDQNVRSVQARYTNDTPETLPGPTVRYWQEPYKYPYKETAPKRIPTEVEGLKIVTCYEYQSCEDDGWEKSEAHRECARLVAALIRALPGYEEVPWEWEWA